MLFGKTNRVSFKPLSIDSIPLDTVNEWKYLGTTLVAGATLSFSARPEISSFFRAANSILRTLDGAHEQILVNLLYSNCVPILTYACDVKEFSARDMSDCNVAVNNALRKVFGFSTWQSIRVLREIFGFQSLYEIFKSAQDRFISQSRSHSNPILSFLVALAQ